MSAPYSEIANASSLEELLHALRVKKAKQFVDGGGPKCWTSKLEKMGASKYNLDVIKEMETLWGIRHLIIHSNGISPSDFVRRHPNFSVAVGEKIHLNFNHLRNWSKAIYDFIQVTDIYAIQRCKVSPNQVQG